MSLEKLGLMLVILWWIFLGYVINDFIPIFDFTFPFCWGAFTVFILIGKLGVND